MAKRSQLSKGLPPNCYASMVNGTAYYAYKHPVTKKRHGIGADRNKAIRITRLTNDKLAERLELERSLATGLIKVDMLCAEYKNLCKQLTKADKISQSTADNRGYTMDRLRKELGNMYVRDVKTFDITKYLNRQYDPKTGEGTPRGRDAQRSHIVYLFTYAQQEGYIEGSNPAEPCLIINQKRITKRHTKEGWNAIYNVAEHWLQCAMDLSVLILQRRVDIVNLKFTDIKDGYLHVIQQKSKKHDSARIKIKITPDLAEVINRCRSDNVFSPYLIHRVPEKRTKSAVQSGNHRTYVTPDYLSRAFKKARTLAGVYSDWSEDEKGGIHEGKALGSKLSKNKTGDSAQTLSGHSSKKMTLNYEADPDDIEWKEAIPQLNLKNDLKS